MRLTCDVDVSNRLLPSFNLSSKGKVCRSQLSIGRKPGSDQDGEVYLMVCTKQDRNGAKYKLKGNIEQIFTKFMSDGKATIRFKEPPHDVRLSKADPLQLKGLLGVMRMAVQGHQGLEKITLSSLAPPSAKQVEKLKTRLSIHTRRDYPITTNFSKSLEVLQVLTCTLKKIDSRILELRNLTKLDLSQNCIQTLPDNFEGTPCLGEINLANNQITDIPAGFCSGSLSKSLTLLDLSHNKLKMLKPYFGKLQCLVLLRLDNNELAYLPSGLGMLGGLRNLSAANNQLRTLPGNMTWLQLDSLDIHNNAFLEDGPSTPINRLHEPSLLEWASRAILKYKLPYTIDDVGPLYNYLNNSHQCMCGSYCFQSHVHYLTRVDLRRVASTVTAIDTRGRTHAPCEAFLCSQTCFDRYKKNPYATIWK